MPRCSACAHAPRTDDTKALLAAIAAASAYAKKLGGPKTGMANGGSAGVAVTLPPGRFRLTQYIELTQSNVAVRGAGVRRTRAPAASAQAHGAMFCPPGSLVAGRATRLSCPTSCPTAAQVDRTVLYFPKPLSSVYGNQMAWSYMGGFLTCVLHPRRACAPGFWCCLAGTGSRS